MLYNVILYLTRDVYMTVFVRRGILGSVT